MADGPHLNVTLLGGFRLTINQQPQNAINQPQQQALLAYLVLHTHAPQLRRQIAFLFWPDASEARAYANLRRALHKLRHDCPAIDHFLVSTSTTLAWRRAPGFTLDVLTYESLLEQAAATPDADRRCRLLQQAAACYRGELLPGCYEEWLLAKREELNQQQLQLLHQLVDRLVSAGDLAAAIHYAGELCRHDPFREESYRRLMTLHEANTDRAAALRTYHDCIAMLERELGVEPGPETQALYQRLLKYSAATVDVKPSPVHRNTTRIPRLVGRAVELQQLQTAWQQAIAGEPHLLLIQGEAGIGKTHLAEALLAWCRQRNHLTVQTRAYAAEGQLSYSPVVEWLRTPPYANLVTELADVWLTECSRLLPELLTARPDLASPPPLTDNWQRRRLFEALAYAVLTPRRPLMVLIDDMQWADQETLEWLHFLLRFDPNAPLLLVGTVRQSEVPATHPLTNLQQELQRAGRIRELMLAPLTAEASAELAEQTAGSQLQAQTLADLHHYAEGVPLFLVEAVQVEIDKAEDDRWRWSPQSPNPTPNTLPLPPKVYAVIQTRLNTLSSSARQLVNVAAVIGRAFSFELLALVVGQDEERLIQSLDELWQRRILREQGSNYDLSHDRIRDVAYIELSPTHCKLLHRRVAEVLLQSHAANLDPIGAQLAYHYEAASLFNQAVNFYLTAGKAAQQVYANHQACALLERGIALITQLPATDQQDEQALALYTHLAISQQALMGWTSTEMYETVKCAWQLSQRMRDHSHRFRLLKFMFSYHLVRGDMVRVNDLTAQLVEIAKEDQSATFHVLIFNAVASLDFLRGDFTEADRNFSKSLAHYKPQQNKEHSALDGVDYGILSKVWRTHSLWLRGFPTQALNECRQGITWARESGYPFSEGQALAYQTLLYLLRQEVDKAADSAETCLATVARYNIGYYGQMAQIIYTWIQAMHHTNGAELAKLHAALAEFEAIGAKLRWPFYQSLLAQFYAQAGQVSEGFARIEEALSTAAQSQETWWNAELYRLRGNLFLQRGQDGDRALAAQSYQQAIDLAHVQGARILALRAATDLARLWQTEGECEQAHALLAPIYATFTEGFETPDLLAAHRLLTDLAG